MEIESASAYENRLDHEKAKLQRRQAKAEKRILAREKEVGKRKVGEAEESFGYGASVTMGVVVSEDPYLWDLGAKQAPQEEKPLKIDFGVGSKISTIKEENKVDHRLKHSHVALSVRGVSSSHRTPPKDPRAQRLGDPLELRPKTRTKKEMDNSALPATVFPRTSDLLGNSYLNLGSWSELVTEEKALKREISRIAQDYGLDWTPGDKREGDRTDDKIRHSNIKGPEVEEEKSQEFKSSPEPEEVKRKRISVAEKAESQH
ncbi:6535_t:CDS:2 [Acaulospora colombiana]|uniref:6535_t:CDS:1 n=1 Tax=Acaulospora colombiana TaxID=27376 RepID=A0ACA9LJA0_9GLOM|nr:6535_t:CDS:2 [Acaulospora colombiana]